MRSFFSHAMPESPWNLGLLLIFAALFVGIAAWNLRPSRRRAQDDLARLPLND